MRHDWDCPGEGCQICEARIANAEYERDHPEPVHDYYDGT